MISILASGIVPTSSFASKPAPGSSSTNLPLTYQVPTIQIMSSLSLSTVQTLPYPFGSLPPPPPQSGTSPPRGGAAAVNAAPAVRLLATGPNYKSPFFVLSTPADRTAAATEGSTVWALSMQSWGAQIDELVDVGSYAEALTLLDTLDTTALPDKVSRRITLALDFPLVMLVSPDFPFRIHGRLIFEACTRLSPSPRGSSSRRSRLSLILI